MPSDAGPRAGRGGSAADAVATDHPIDPHHDGGEECPGPRCPCAGYELFDGTTCVDRNECRDGTAACGPRARCIDLPGGYSCRCFGYYTDVRGDGSLCEDERLVDASIIGPGYVVAGYAIGYDGAGDLLMAGDFDQSVRFGADLHTSAGSHDVFAAKLDSALQPHWSVRYGGTGDDRAIRLVSDSANDLLIIGLFHDTIDFGGASMPIMSELPDSGSGFLAKLDGRDGTGIWSRRLPVVGFFVLVEGWPYTIDVDAQDNVYVGGRFIGTHDFGTAGGPVTSSGIAPNLYIAKYASDGTPLWIHTASSAGTAGVTGLAVDRYGDVVVTGFVEGPAPWLDERADPAGVDAFLMKLDSEGQRLWAIRYGSSGFDFGQAVDVAADGAILTSGSHGADFLWDEAMLPIGDGRGVYIAKTSRDGARLWLHGARSELNPDGSGELNSDAYALIEVDGDAVVNGMFGATLIVDERTTLTAFGTLDLWVARFGAGGEVWSQQFGSISYDEGESITRDPAGNVLVSGWMAGPAAFGETVLDTPGWLGAPLIRLRP